MPGTEHAQDCIPRLSLSDDLGFDTRLFLEMQIKKMKEIIPQLYTDQVNDRNNSLTTSPKQRSTDFVNQFNGHEAQSHGYQDPKAEDDKTCLVTCVRCRSVQKLSLQELKRDSPHGQNEEHMVFVCVKCNLGSSPPFPSMNDIPGVIDSGNKDTAISRTMTNQFKVKNFQPGKYYCDKCRFSTKDPLQYKKHTLQHEEIKFFCSHCSYVSYTKGEFQRHLVKHTGTFPYQCEYCDYGAVRNDYIVKHTRRVHETGGEKRPFKQAVEHQSKRSNFSKQNSEVPVNEVSKSNYLLNEPSDLPLCFPGPGDQDKAGHAISLPESKECSKDEAASAPDKACLPEPSKVNFFENENVEVELLSPAKEPVQPGIPLTVVAPAELRVPDNCLAQLIDVKVVNGTQQLVLKLIPLKDKNGLKPGSSDEGKYELENKSTVPNEQEKLVPTEQTPPSVGRSPEKPSIISNLHSTDCTHGKHLGCRKSSVSQVLKDKLETNQSQCESCPSSDRIGDWRQEVLSVPYRAALSPVSPRDGNIKQNNFSSLSVVNNGALCSPVKRSGVLPHVSALSPQPGRSQNHLEKSLSDCKPAEAVGAFAKRDVLPVSPGMPLHRNEMDTLEMVSLNEKPKQAQTKEPSDDSNSIQDSSLHSEQSHINLIRENVIKTQDPEDVTLEDLVGGSVQNSGSNITPSDGPIISSVFSLSSGIENVPEGITWDDTSCKTKSVSSLHRRIAELIAATESSKSPLSSVEQQFSSLKTPIDCVLGHNAPNYSLTSSQVLQSNVADMEQLSHEQMQHQDNEEEQARAEETRKDPDTVPMCIPKENEHLVENKLPCDVFGNERLSPKSVLSSLEHIGKDFSLTNENQSADSFRNLDMSLENKPDEEFTTSTVSNKSNSACSPLKEGNDHDKQEKMIFGSPSGSNINTEEAVISKKIPVQSNSSPLLPDVCIFMTSRHLRLRPVRTAQLIKCPRRNQPVVVLNHPDVDSVEVMNVMKVVHKYKGNVLKVVLSERTCDQLGIKRHHRRLIYQNMEAVFPVKKQTVLKMKLKKIRKNSYQVQNPESPVWVQCMSDSDSESQEFQSDDAQQQHLEEQDSGTATQQEEQ
ncbi:zinc finger protein 518B isoform X2 [Macrotis lagotis]|uniref:zinc finger protein 518B isoform X2 n=1 Tax=Macrotis lagotis TaxID=92651 RepID=UPI003D69000D